MKKLLLIPFVLLLCGFDKEKAAIGQPKDERFAQDKLPKSSDPIWKVLGTTKIKSDYAQGYFDAIYSPEVKALVGKEVTISGFMLPLEATEKFKHFILSKRTPTCPFCPPGEPNEIIDIWMAEPVKWDEDTIKVSGKFELMNNRELGMFFKLTDAKKF